MIQSPQKNKSIAMPNPEELVIAGEAGFKALEVGRLPGLLDLLGENGASVGVIKSALKLAPDNIALGRVLDMEGTKLGLELGQIKGLTPYDWKFLESKIAFGDLTLADRTTQPVFIHVFGEADHAPWPETLDRLRKERAAQFISANLFNTVPRAGLRNLEIGPSVLLTQSDSIARLPQIANTEIGKSAQSLYSAILEGRPVQALVSQDIGYSLDVHPALKGLTDQGKFELLLSKPAASRAFEKATIEREVLGDTDGHFGNFALSGGLTRSRIGNLDFEFALKESPLPLWDDSYVYHNLAGQPLRTSTVNRVGNFAQSFGSRSGRNVLRDLQLTDPEVDGMISRATWFAEHKTYPQILD